MSATNTRRVVRSAKSGRQPQQRNWCFTLNNYTESEVDSIPDSIGRPFGKGSEPNAIVFVGVAEEVGESGTPHLQGYLQLRKKGMWIRGSVVVSVLEVIHGVMSSNPNLCTFFFAEGKRSGWAQP